MKQLSKSLKIYSKKKDVDKISQEKEKEKNERINRNVIKKIPYDNKYQLNTMKTIEVDNRLKIDDHDKNTLNSYIIRNINLNDKKKLSNMRNKLDEIFSTKVSSIDKLKYSTYFRKGLSQYEKKTFDKDNPTIIIPCVQKKKRVEIRARRPDGEFDLNKGYKSVGVFRHNVFKFQNNLMNRDIVMTMEGNYL